MLYAIGFNMNEFHKKFKYSCELNMEKVNSFRNDYPTQVYRSITTNKEKDEYDAIRIEI